jgi:hypothetical protein
MIPPPPDGCWTADPETTMQTFQNTVTTSIPVLVIHGDDFIGHLAR